MNGSTDVGSSDERTAATPSPPAMPHWRRWIRCSPTPLIVIRNMPTRSARVLAIPPKRHQRTDAPTHRRTDVTYLTTVELFPLLAAPDRPTQAGRRDHALLQTAVTTTGMFSEFDRSEDRRCPSRARPRTPFVAERAGRIEAHCSIGKPWMSYAGRSIAAQPDSRFLPGDRNTDEP